jgi:hypothetical protein
MKIKWVIPVLMLVSLQCKKTDTVTGTVCVSNKTGNEFNGYSFIDVVTGNNLFRVSNLKTDAQECTQLKDNNNAGIWSAYFSSPDQLILATWTGTFSVNSGQTGTIEITNKAKKNDYRRPLWGNYNLTCMTAEIKTATNDTLSKSNQAVIGKVDSLLNVLSLHLTATGFLDTIIQYDNSGINFTAPGGTVQFSPGDSTMQFHIIKTTAPGVEKRCQCAGRHKY